MTKQQFDILCNRAVEVIRRHCPIDTGNLRYNAIQFLYEDDNTFTVYVDFYDNGKNPTGIGYYMAYTNEPWISKRWHGKKNKNEGWWQKALEEIKEMIRNEFGGENNDNT